MTKKKKPETEPEPTPPVPTPEQTYTQQVQQVLDEWPTASVDLLHQMIEVLDRPDDGSTFNPMTSESSLSVLRNHGAGLLERWYVPKPGPKPAEMPRREPSTYDLERAADRKRIEESYKSVLDMRRLINEDRYREGKPLLPETD